MPFGGVIFLILSIALFIVMLMLMPKLLVLALYGLYKSNACSNFKELYIKMLSLGGSVSPKELVGMFGFDIEDKSFWEIGIVEIKKLIDEFMRLK